MAERFLGVDVGAETIKVAELVRDEGGRPRLARVELVEHHKEPERALVELLDRLDWAKVDGAAVSGRFGRQVQLPAVPIKKAQAQGLRHLIGDGPATVVSIGGHGFSVLELRDSGVEVIRENSRCSQGTGNFLRQLVERFDLSIEAASALCEAVEDPAPLSGRCPVILKTDMTHLANKGESQARILAGLYDAVCENVQVLIKPRVSPPRLYLTGGVTRSLRIQENFARFCERHEMELVPRDDTGGLFLEAIGAALTAAEAPKPVPPLSEIIRPPEEDDLERRPALADYLPKIKRMPQPATAPERGHRKVVLGFDIGSTGSKAVAWDPTHGEVVWEGYVSTSGSPVSAARSLLERFVEGPAGHHSITAFGATGSGREIVGSLLSTCYGVERVYVINEIAAHAEGALHFDARVDTIFEIGGQDAKYIRLAEGRVVDAAMNEACSAGTGSFIEEQGRKFAGIDDVVQLGQEAIGAAQGVSLGQHCSVFMAEIIDGAVAAGIDNRTIIAGIYDSIIQNYLNRVKGSRSVGDVIFCQGMPFSADALAASVVRQTGSEVVVPPNPGTVGALGISLLTAKAIPVETLEPVEASYFLGAEVLRKDTFHCGSTKGCGGGGNKCRIDRIRTRVQGRQQKFTWGGGCSLWDRGTGKQKLPDLTPDPFREREALIEALLERVSLPRGGKRIALTDEFNLKGLLPFFATFLWELGFDLQVRRGADQGALKRGIEEANVPFCAPMQQYHGLVSEMSEEAPDFLFLPMLQGIQRIGDEPHSVVCPIVQASPDMLKWDLGEAAASRMISTVISVGEGGLDSQKFMQSCQQVAIDLGVLDTRWWRAYHEALEAQRAFDSACLRLGDRALAFCCTHSIVPVVVLGRAYTIYNKVLNSNVPAILREQGAIAIPVDCYEVSRETPIFKDVYWGYGQRNLRAAHQARREHQIYTLWCSNYSCGPDSFNLHFYAYLMQGKPFAVIETDGHSGDAGTKTRVEAFLHCVRSDLDRQLEAPKNSLVAIEQDTRSMPEIAEQGETILVPLMGVGAPALAACFRAVGLNALALPMPDREAVRIGRRYTSGKECLPMTITLGSLLQYLEQQREGSTRYTLLMPTANGPCRFGVYNMLHKIVLERLGWKDRVRVWSPNDEGYFDGLAPGFSALVMTGFAVADMLQAGLHHARPVERYEGAAQHIFDRYTRELHARLESATKGELGLTPALLQAATGRLFGCADILKRAAAEFAAIRTDKQLPTVSVVGEIYVRCDPFANDFTIERLEKRGLRVLFAPFTEWLEYTDLTNRTIIGTAGGFGDKLSALVQMRILTRTYSIMADRLGWPARTSVKDSMNAAAPYVREDLLGEAVITVGGPVHEFRHGAIQGVVNLGPLECMPAKIAEAQFFHIAEHEGLLSLTLPLNGDPVDPQVLDNFAFEVHAAFKKEAKRPEVTARRPGRSGDSRGARS